uniref:Ribonuclease H2 subunit C n=1 Tax=Syphacia muris TaxID=451379 RepID=A0A0N5AR37_9BILA
MLASKSISPAVIIVNNNNKKSNDESHLEVQSMPCKIDYTGAASVSKYMLREQHADGNEKSTFRGRFLDGQKLQLPLDYKLFVLKERRSTANTDVYDVEKINDDFMVWEYDKEPSSSDPIRQAIKFLEIAKDLATE